MLRLIVGVSRKIGLPFYSSAGASCQIEIELAPDLLDEDPRKFRDEVRRAYAAAHQAVRDDLAPWESLTAPHHSRSQTTAITGETRPAGEHSRPIRRATDRQLQAIASLAKRRRIDIHELVASLGVDQPESLTVTQASELISRLRSHPWI